MSQDLSVWYSELWALRDPRLDSWPMMSSPLPTLALSLAYVVFVTGLGPWIMKDRSVAVLTITMINQSAALIAPHFLYFLMMYSVSTSIFRKNKIRDFLLGKKHN